MKFSNFLSEKVHNHSDLLADNSILEAFTILLTLLYPMAPHFVSELAEQSEGVLKMKFPLHWPQPRQLPASHVTTQKIVVSVIFISYKVLIC